MNYQHHTGCLLDPQCDALDKQCDALDKQCDALEQQTSPIQILEGGDKTRERKVCDVFVNID